PFPLIGHTLNHSWGLTMFENDDIDLYREKIEGTKYLKDSTWHELALHKEIIKVKDSDDVEFQLRETDHGVIINDVLVSVKESDPIAMWWIYNKYPKNVIVEAAYKFSRSTNMKNFREAASMLHAPGLNIMYGDSEGNIAWWASAKLPIRPSNIDPKEIIDGTNSKNDILGWYDFSKNPHSVNPEKGYVYSANNAPGPVDGIHYPGYYYHGNTRAKSIIDALEAKKDSWTMADVQKLQLNGVSPTYRKNKEMMLSYLNKNILDESELVILKEVENWQGTHDIKEIAPTIYYKWMYNTLSMTFKDDMGSEKFEAFMNTIIWERSFPELLKNAESPWWNIASTEKKESANEIITSAFKKSCKDLEIQLGEDFSRWNWGEVHTVTYEHPMGKVEPLDKIFNIGPFPAHSGKDALNKLGFHLDSTGVYKITSGPSERVVIDFADVEYSESILPTGQSGNPFSDYYSNQVEKYNEGKYRTQRMNKEDIEANKTAEAFINPL
ncbi:MAG: penicillin acylase family protein, partial [Flavobacteriales bacterium]|nr:penicillin acylase family protein [Flavobacteriales bacterium]